MVRDFERQAHSYSPGLRLNAIRFLDDDTIELTFEGIDAPGLTTIARREVANGISVLTFDSEFSRLYRGVPCVQAGLSLNPLVAQMFAARADELPSGAEWDRVRAECEAELERRWSASEPA